MSLSIYDVWPNSSLPKLISFFSDLNNPIEKSVNGNEYRCLSKSIEHVESGEVSFHS